MQNISTLSRNPIELALETLHITQNELARRIGVTSGHIYQWKKRGYITQKYLAKAVEVTGIPAFLLNPYIPNPANAYTKSN